MSDNDETIGPLPTGNAGEVDYNDQNEPRDDTVGPLPSEMMQSQEDVSEDGDSVPVPKKKRKGRPVHLSLNCYFIPNEPRILLF